MLISGSRGAAGQGATRGVEGAIPLPSLLGALLVKVRAIDIDDEPDAQRRDCAFLFSLVDDPDALARELTKTERGWLNRHPEFGDPTSEVYEGVPSKEDAAIVFRRLV